MIEPMQQEHLSAVMEIWLAGNLQAHPFLPAGDWLGVYQDVQENIQAAEVYVYNAQGVICGFLGMRGNYVAGLFAARSQQGQGVGKALLQFAQQKKDALILHVFAENERAVQFYQASGFHVTKEQQQSGHLEYEMQWRAKIDADDTV